LWCAQPRRRVIVAAKRRRKCTTITSFVDGDLRVEVAVAKIDSELARTSGMIIIPYILVDVVVAKKAARRNFFAIYRVSRANGGKRSVSVKGLDLIAAVIVRRDPGRTALLSPHGPGDNECK
jgi:hypothetical protein